MLFRAETRRNVEVVAKALEKGVPHFAPSYATFDAGFRYSTSVDKHIINARFQVLNIGNVFYSSSIANGNIVGSPGANTDDVIGKAVQRFRESVASLLLAPVGTEIGVRPIAALEPVP